MKYKILSIVGARPNFIKAAPVSKALAAEGVFDEIIVHTGQHYDYKLSEAFFNELEIPAPKYNLEIGSGPQAWQLGQMISGLGEVIKKEKPAAVIVFGDTNSTAAGAIAAAKSNVVVAHVEAGLREFDKTIPEEVNKMLTDAVTDLYFCPTPTGVKNLANTGITENVHLVGDVGIDLICHHLDRIKNNRGLLDTLGVSPGSYYLMTCHRAVNTDIRENLAGILEAVRQIDHPVIWPIHPRTEKAIRAWELPSPREFLHVTLLPPLGFFDTQTLIHYAEAVITDSGGIVKEAYFHKVPGLILQPQIEWIETVDEGWNHLTGPDTETILRTLTSLEKPGYHSNCLGDGTASRNIANILFSFLKNKNPG